MNRLRAFRRVSGVVSLIGVALAAGGCVHVPELNPYKVGDVNRDSTVSAEVVAGSRAPGTYPHFNQIPVVPTDVRPVPDWRTAVVSEWGQKRQTEREAAAIPFTLANSEDWAQKTRAKIPSGEQSQPTPSIITQTEAYAASQRARATPPPPPQ